MSVAGIEALSSFSPVLAGGSSAADTAATARAADVEGPTGPSFGRLLATSIEGLEGMHDHADNLSVQAATGDLGAIHDYTLAATETKVATELTVAVRNKAVEAFNEILRMQV